MEYYMEYKIVRAVSDDDYRICDSMMSKLINFESTIDPLLNSGVVVNGFNKSVASDDSFVGYATNGSPIGYVCALLNHKKGSVNATNMISIETLYVEEAYRGQGIAKALVSSVEEWAYSLYKDDYSLEITTLTHNKSAIDIYSHLGFSPVRVTLRKEKGE